MPLKGFVRTGLEGGYRPDEPICDLRIVGMSLFLSFLQEHKSEVQPEMIHAKARPFSVWPQSRWESFPLPGSRDSPWVAEPATSPESTVWH